MVPKLLKESTYYDNKVDIFSFDVVGFFILSRKLPHLNIVQNMIFKVLIIKINSEQVESNHQKNLKESMKLYLSI